MNDNPESDDQQSEATESKSTPGPTTDADTTNDSESANSEQAPESESTRFDDQIHHEPFEADYGDDGLNHDVQSVLDPISGDAPSGQSDEEAESVIAQIEANIEPIFDSIKNDFNAMVGNDDMSGFDSKLSGSDAAELSEQALECLKSKCKSAILCSQLPKLLFISHGLAGLRAGLDIFSETIKRFGSSIFPTDAERTKLYFRGGVYIGNDDKVTETFRLLLFIPITDNKNLPYAFLRNSRLIKANPDVERRYGQDASETSPEFYVALIDELSKVIEACHRANETTESYIQDPMVQPALMSFQFIKSLEKMKAIVVNLATEHCNGYPPVEESDAESTESEQGKAKAKEVKAAQGEIVSREQAIELLGKIADYFHRTERHSPISYSIRKLIGWTKMDLPELIQELLDGNSEPLNEFSKRTGVQPKSDEESG